MRSWRRAGTRSGPSTRRTSRRHGAPEAGGDQDSPPRIWAGSLADYTAGYLHGAWLDATLEPADLTNAIRFILNNAREPDAEEYGIFDYDGFGHGVTTLLGEYPSLKTVSKIAQGIAEHGQAFAAWAAYVGPEREAQLDRFEDHYLGEWDSVKDYVEDLLDNTGFNHELERALRTIPEDTRGYINVDVDSLARDWGEMLETCGSGREGRTFPMIG